MFLVTGWLLLLFGPLSIFNLRRSLLVLWFLHRCLKALVLYSFQVWHVEGFSSPIVQSWQCQSGITLSSSTMVLPGGGTHPWTSNFSFLLSHSNTRHWPHYTPLFHWGRIGQVELAVAAESRLLRMLVCRGRPTWHSMFGWFGVILPFLSHGRAGLSSSRVC